MSDLISRQAAIEAIGNYLKKDGDQIVIADVVDAAVAIGRLPSAQPEQRWIPCSERLPEEDADYLVTFENGEMRTASKEGITQNYRYGMKMLAWMPLPEPYTERRKG